MAEGARQLTPTDTRRRRGGFMTLGLITLIVGSALAATLIIGFGTSGTTRLEGLAQPALFTLWQAALSTLLSVGIAIPIALALENLTGWRGRNFATALFAIPLSLPAIVAVLAIVAFAGRSGWLAQVFAWFGLGWKPDIYGLGGILLAHVFFNMPLAVRLMLTAFANIPQEQWKLAASLKFPVFSRIQIVLAPALRGALPGIAGLIFMLCAGSYTIVLVLGGGPAASTLQTAILEALTFDLDIGRAAQLTLLQLAMTAGLLWLLPDTHIPATASRTGQSRRWHHTGGVETLVALSLSTIGAAFVALPLAAMAISGLGADHVRLLGEDAFQRAFMTSMMIGTLSATIALASAWTLSAARHAFLASAKSTRWSGLLDRLPIALLGLPPLVLGTGWFLIALNLGLIRSAAPVLVIIANALMALPFALQIIGPALGAHFTATDRLAASVRVPHWQRLRIIDLPSMKRPLIQAFAFTFALSLGDLGVITLFGNDSIQTLPSLILQKMGSYRTDDAAGVALWLAVLTGVLAYISTREERSNG